MTRTIAEVLRDARADREAATLAEGAPWSRSDVFIEDAAGEPVASTDGGKHRALNNAVHIAHNDPARVRQRAADVEALAARVEGLQQWNEGARRDYARLGDALKARSLQPADDTVTAVLAALERAEALAERLAEALRAIKRAASDRQAIMLMGPRALIPVEQIADAALAAYDAKRKDTP